MRQPGVFHLLPQEDHADREENAKAKQAGYQIQFQLLHGEVLIPTAANRQAVVSWQHLGILKGNGDSPDYSRSLAGAANRRGLHSS